jgi:RND family efflux transporter MFP subunit
VRQVSANVQSTGSFIAEETSDVAPDVAGRIVATLVNVGDSVQAGQPIARLDDREATVKLDQAKAALQQAEAAVRQAQSRIGLASGDRFDPNKVPEVLAAKASYESAAAQAKLAQADANRYENLINTGDVSRSAYDKAKTQVETAEAQLNAARQQYEATLNAARQNYQGVANSQASLDQFRAALALAQKGISDMTIRAPFAGYVSARPVAAGEYVALTAKIATILRITPIKLQLQVPESNASRMAPGLDVVANVPGYPGRDFAGKVTAINPQVDMNARTFTVEAEFPNRDLALKPGMFATARIQLPGNEQGIFVPQRAVMKDATTNSSQVFFIRDGKARLAVVQLGDTDGDRIRIVTGLAADAQVALDHLQDLYDGQSVKAELK